MSDIFNKEQAKRLFAIIAAGASLGALVGPIIPTFFADSLGGTNASLIASILIVLIIPIVIRLERLKKVQLQNDDLQSLRERLPTRLENHSWYLAFSTTRYLNSNRAKVLLLLLLSRRGSGEKPELGHPLYIWNVSSQFFTVKISEAYK